MNIEKKREHEKETMESMIRIYCRGKHGSKRGQLCKECSEVLEYAKIRTNKCPFMETKTFCSACKVHCYSKDMKEKVKDVMRYAGPRMTFSHPILVIKHGLVTVKAVREQKKAEKKNSVS